MHKFLNHKKENKNLLKVEDENSDMWKLYTSYVDKIIVEGFHKIVQTTLNYFLKGFGLFWGTIPMEIVGTFSKMLEMIKIWMKIQQGSSVLFFHNQNKSYNFTSGYF